MKILRHDQTDLSVALRALSEKLATGIQSAASEQKTLEVFGKPLTPIEVVRKILADVRERGDSSVAEYTEKLDGCRLTPEQFAVPRDEMAEAWGRASQEFKDSLVRAKENIWRFQEHIRHKAPAPMRNAEGGIVGVQYRALGRVGIYAPGGRAAYPSTVLMTAIPAQVAGVREIALVTPCSPDGTIRTETLAACHECGLTEVYRVAGAQAIAALAYGTATIPRVDKIVGPGNLFVTLAKREVYGAVDLDMLAGPSEILIIADSFADPHFLAADLLSQAEHDPAAPVLLTPDENVAQRTLEEVEVQLRSLPRAKAASECLERYGFVAVTRDLSQAVSLANQFCPEHLELAVEDPKELLPELRHAGAIFVGRFTPESVGDYIAGPSHVLPTGGTARFFSGLNANDFIRRTSVILYSDRALAEAAPHIERIAQAEGLDAHARAATIRVLSAGTEKPK